MEIPGQRQSQSIGRRSADLFYIFWGQVGEGNRKSFNAANLGLQIIKHFGVMRGEEDPSLFIHHAGSRWETSNNAAPHSSSTLLDKIRDQQIYLSLTSTLLRLAKEAGTPEDSLSQVRSSLLTARGLQPHHLLSSKQPSNQNRDNSEKYNWLNRGATLAEEQALLQKLEKITLESRQNQSHYLCLSKFKAEKSDEIAPSSSANPVSKKDRFKRMIKQRKGRWNVESSDFYRFSVNQILQNSYKYQNECYRTVSSFSHLKTMFGHTTEPDMETYSQIFNAILDRSQNLIITGGEQGLIKVWHRKSGSLIANLKGHTDYLNKIDTSICNKYLLTTAADGLRFFDLATLKPLGGWNTSSYSEISSFMENGQNYFLFGDSSILFVLKEETMLANTDKRLSPELFYQFKFGGRENGENCVILVISMNPKKTHILIGLQNGWLLMVRVKDLLTQIEDHQPGEELTLPSLQSVKAHMEQIIEIKWSHKDNLWATGGKDGKCCLWQLENNRMEVIKNLNVNSKSQRGRRKKNVFSCTYICWNCVYSHFAAGFQENVEEEDSDRGRGEVLVFSLNQNAVTCELSRDVSQEYGGIRAMDPHPTFPNILLICQADGHILLFDIFVGCIVNTFQERGFHILHPQFQLIPTECHFTKDGLSFVVATEYGSISLYGYDDKSFYTATPAEQFLKTDFQQFQIEENTMRAISLARADEDVDDINNYPKGDLLSVRGEKHHHTITIDPQSLLRAINNPTHPKHHFPQISLDGSFLQIIHQNLKEVLTHEQIYSKTYQQIQKIKALVLFHQRQRQYLTVSNITAEKLKALKSKATDLKVNQQNQIPQMMIPEAPRRTRALERHPSRQRINYQDDFEYDESKEEDYNAEQSFLENDGPDQLEEEFSQEDDEEQAARHRRNHQRANPNRRQTRRQVRPNYTMDVQNEEEEEQQEVRHTRRRRDLFDEEEIEQEIEHPPRKKQKVEEESQQHRGYSRLRKQVEENKEEQPEVGECYRCLITKAAVFCFNCPYTQQFCSECSKMRGKRQRDRYLCLFCHFFKNTSPEERTQVCQNNYQAVKRSEENYLPQLEDQVRFFFQGYEEFLVQNITKLNPLVYKNNPSFRLLPHTEDNSLSQTPLCEVVSIEYFFPLKSENLSQKRTPGKGEKNQIQMVLGLKPVEEGPVFWIYYLPGQQYLISEDIYQQIHEKQIISKLRINELVKIKDEEMQIVELGAFEDRFPETLWKVLKVRKTEGKRLRGNTKQIQKRINLWKIEGQIVEKQHQNAIQPNVKEMLTEQVRIWTQDVNSSFCIFNDYVDFEIYPAYRSSVEVGICLKTILKRLQNNYYTGQLSLEHDVDLILKNSLNFNGNHHKVTKDAEELVIAIKTILNKGEVPTCPIKNYKEDTTSKKQKKVRGSEEKVKESEDNFSSFVVEDALVTKKKDDSYGVNMRKRRKVSSEEEDESFSSEHFGLGVSTRRGNRTRNGYQPQQPRRITRSSNRH